MAASPCPRGVVHSFELQRASLQTPFAFGIGYTADNRHVFVNCAGGASMPCQDGDQILQLGKHAVATLTHEVLLRRRVQPGAAACFRLASVADCAGERVSRQPAAHAGIVLLLSAPPHAPLLPITLAPHSRTRARAFSAWRTSPAGCRS